MHSTPSIKVREVLVILRPRKELYNVEYTTTGGENAKSETIFCPRCGITWAKRFLFHEGEPIKKWRARPLPFSSSFLDIAPKQAEECKAFAKYELMVYGKEKEPCTQ